MAEVSAWRRSGAGPAGGPRWVTDSRGSLQPRSATRNAELALRADGRHARPRRRVHQPATPGRTRAVRVVPRPGGRADRGGGVLAQDRLVVPQYREIGAFLLRGITPAQMGAVWRGKWHGGLGFTEKCSRPIAIPIGTHGLHAVGAAMGAQRLGEDSVTLAFLGDGATSEGDAHEALNFAAVFKAPCVFFIQNNQWAISVPISHQMAGPSIAHRAIGYGMPGIRVDGNDVLACYAVTRGGRRAGP